MAGGTVDRNVLSSNYQDPGQAYDDKKTEGAFEVIAQQVDNNWTDINTRVASYESSLTTHKTSGDHDARYYTKDELAPYLQGGDTSIKYEVFTIVTSNNGDGTFTYRDGANVDHTGTITAEGYQTFTLQKGTYGVGQNRITCMINDTLQRSVASGGLQEVDSTHVTLTMPEGAGAELTIQYFERVGITGEHNIVYGSATPPTSSDSTMWFKVVG